MIAAFGYSPMLATPLPCSVLDRERADRIWQKEALVGCG
jgi:hypothetical protein